MTAPHEERRRFHRIGFDAPVVLVQGDKRWDTQVQDVSLKGLLTDRPANWSADPEAPLEATLDLGGSILVTLKVALMRDQADSLGFACQHIDLDSISHLRRLVELNLGDEQLLERDLTALGA